MQDRRDDEQASLLTDDNDSHPVSPDGPSKVVLKTGFITFGSGLGLTILGAAGLGSNNYDWHTLAGFVHRLGMIAMLLGLCIVALAYRIVWLAKFRDRLRMKVVDSSANVTNNPASLDRSISSVISPESEYDPLPVVVLAIFLGLTQLLIGIVACGLVFAVQGADNMQVLAALMVLIASLSILLVAGVMCRGYAKAYALGALAFALPSVITYSMSFQVIRYGIGYGTASQSGAIWLMNVALLVFMHLHGLLGVTTLYLLRLTRPNPKMLKTDRGQ